MQKTKPAKSILPSVLLCISTPGLATDLRIAAELMHFDYEETDLAGSTLNQETGYIPGFSIGASRPWLNTGHSIEFSLYGGGVDYDGQTQGGQPHQTTTEQTIYRFLYRLGWSPQDTDGGFYGEIYWQQWDRDIQPNNGVSGLFERYQWWSIEAGVEVPLVRKDRHDLLLELGVLKTFNGTILIDLSSSNNGEPVLDLGSEIGFSGGIEYEFRHSQTGSLRFGINFRTWEFGRSNSATISNGLALCGEPTCTIVEPDSTTVQTTISAGYVFHF
jgi:hypothetical protein